MVTIYIEGKAYKIKQGQNLLQACLGLGFDLPYFCWHPALGSVGACRQCAVKRFKDENDTRGEIVMACMTPADDGTRISINDPEAVQFRASVIEWLMINHPHDCPVCDEGGECHLQDMTVMTGHNYRHSRFPKRTHRNQDLGPFINHEMNRCIQCYRCVRFYRDYAGGSDLNALASHDHVYFGRFQSGPLESEFSGNLVEICPTGVFTDKSLKSHFTRKWDLQTAPSVCVHCGLGCNTIPGERYDELRRIRNRYHHQVNGYFLCDRGRYGYEFVNSTQRIRHPLRQAGSREEAKLMMETEALELAAAMLADPGKVIGIGSPRAFLESNFALRALVGPERFHAGLSDSDFKCLGTGCNILQRGPVPAATLQGVALADAAFVLGEDVTQTAPLMALNLRQMRYGKSVRIVSDFQVPEWHDAGVREIGQLQSPALFNATPYPTRLDDEAMRTVYAAPHDLVRLGFAVLAALDASVFPMPDVNDAMQALANEIAQALLKAERPLLVAGTGCGNPALIEAAANMAWYLGRKGSAAAFALCVPECNSLGLRLMGGLDLNSAFQAIDEGRADTVVILENDLYRRADAQAVDAMLQKARNIIVIDHQQTATSEKAHLVLPAATFAEATGTLINNEGRAQRGYAVMPPKGAVRAGWRWLQMLMKAAGHAGASSWLRLENLTADLVKDMPVFQPVAGLDPKPAMPTPGGKLPRQSHRYTGRTAMHADIDVSEPKPPADEDAPLAFSMEGYDGRPPAGLISRVWAPGWNSEQSLNKFQSEIGGPLRGGDPGRRLIEPPASDDIRYFAMPEQEILPGADEYLLVPIHHIFGSEELSMASPGVARQAPQPYLALRPEDAPVGDGEQVRLLVSGKSLVLPLKLLPGMPERTAGLPDGLPGVPKMVLPAVVKILGKGSIEK
ncbi:MAG: NADH-quinone oxidoreductase subunit NuoG [Desulfobacterales bacterium]|nr:NADH-quinone oxidoreductase subunit NuoG [Desulfobacterales bacterium]